MDPQTLQVLLFGLLGLLVGSFLNVVIYRLPVMMERQWLQECRSYLAEVSPASLAPQAAGSDSDFQPFDLMRPRSRCGQCGHVLRWYENIPVLSFLALRGRCSQCKTPIAWRYPLVELMTATAFAACAMFKGTAWWPILVWCGYAATLIALAGIDWDTGLLPDNPTLPLMWAGLLASVGGWTGVRPADTVLGAAVGYLSLWTIWWVYKRITGKDGMGHGDFKLMAVLGAWWGWLALVPMLLMACVLGLIAGLWFRARAHAQIDGEGRFAFGPYLAAAGLCALFVHPSHWLRPFGL